MEDSDAKTHMWSCANCREVIEDQFDSCWRCGCSREGKLNLDFLAESTDATDSKDFVCQNAVMARRVLNACG
jgi:hypothetical protein